MGWVFFVKKHDKNGLVTADLHDFLHLGIEFDRMQRLISQIYLLNGWISSEVTSKLIFVRDYDIGINKLSTNLKSQEMM